MKKLKDTHGESMVELIVAFTLFLLAMATLTAMVSVGLRLNRAAADADKAFYGDFSEAEGGIEVAIEQNFAEIYPEPTEIPYYENPAGLIYFGFPTESAAPTDSPAPTESPDPSETGGEGGGETG